MSLSKATKELLELHAPSCNSYADLIRALGLIPAGGNYATIKAKCREFSIDTSHFKGQSWSKDRKRPEMYKSVDAWLTTDSNIRSYKLKLRLFREGILNPICSNCSLSVWLGQPIPTELDHINGDNRDNRLENLRILCPNCHALTETYRGRNIK